MKNIVKNYKATSNFNHWIEKEMQVSTNDELSALLLTVQSEESHAPFEYLQNSDGPDKLRRVSGDLELILFSENARLGFAKMIEYQIQSNALN